MHSICFPSLFTSCTISSFFSVLFTRYVDDDDDDDDDTAEDRPFKVAPLEQPVV